MLLTGYNIYNNLNSTRYSPIEFLSKKNSSKVIMNELEKYEKTNDSFNQEEVNNIVKKRVSTLPKMMNLLVSAPVQYVEGVVGAKKFSGDYVDNFVPFAKRISIGENHKEYCKNYAPEIKMIKKVEKACNDYLNKNETIVELNSSVEDALDSYSKTPINRTKLFIA